MSRRTVVTAGAGGIGLATARRLRADGFEVTVLDIDDEAGAQAAHEGLGFIRTDFGDECAIRAAFAEVGSPA